MAAYWEGKRELFTGLKIESLMPPSVLSSPSSRAEILSESVSLNKSWTPHPVFYFDFDGVNYQEESKGSSALEKSFKVNSQIGKLFMEISSKIAN